MHRDFKVRIETVEVILLLIGVLSVSVSAGAEPLAGKGIVKEIARNDNQITVSLVEDQKKLKITDPKAWEVASLIKTGDRIEIVRDSSDPQVISELKSVERPASKRSRLLALAGGLLVLLLFGVFSSEFKPGKFVIGTDNRYSNSKIQVVLWYSALMTVYLATLGLRVAVWDWDLLGGVGITENLLALSGLSALTYGAAKAVTAHKSAGAPNTKTRAAHPRFPHDLLQDDSGELDLGDSQMLFITLTAVVIFLLTSFHFLSWIANAKEITLPDVDSTLLSTFGLGQGAYLIKKAASAPGEG